MGIPDVIVNKVKKGECILFLGAMASAPSPSGSRYVYTKAPPSGSELCRRLVKSSCYTGDEGSNLGRVSLYFQFKEHGSRKSLVDALEEEITKFEYDEAGQKRDEKFVPSPALKMLAALPFPIIITTNYDHLFDRALQRADTLDGRPKDPLIRIYDPTRNGPPEEVPLDPSEDKPILLKLHGDFSRPESIVITEEDYIVFIQRMSDRDLHPIHEFIRARMKTWPVLFVGYSLKDYNLRLLFRTLRWKVDVANFPLSFSVDPYPDNLIVSVLQGGERPIVSFVQQNLWDFVPELYKRCRGVDYPS